MLPVGFIALLSGWFVTEIGRQPWVVYGVLRTADAVGPSARRRRCAGVVYIASVMRSCSAAGIWYLVQIIRTGPKPHEPAPTLMPAARPRRGRCPVPTNR